MTTRPPSAREAQTPAPQDDVFDLLRLHLATSYHFDVAARILEGQRARVDDYANFILDAVGNVPDAAQLDLSRLMARVLLPGVIYDKAVEFAETSYQYFIKKRLSEDWQKKVVPQIAQWVSGSD